MPPLLKIILRRVGLGILTLFLVSVLVFAATQALPGDTARAILGRSATPERLKELREQARARPAGHHAVREVARQHRQGRPRRLPRRLAAGH